MEVVVFLQEQNTILHIIYDVKRAVLCCDALRISVVYPQLPATSSYLISMASLSVPIAARNSLVGSVLQSVHPT